MTKTTPKEPGSGVGIASLHCPVGAQIWGTWCISSFINLSGIEECVKDTKQ